MMIQEIKEKLGIEVRGFEWFGGFSKANKQHFVEFNGWDGEIYIVNKGILSNKEFYKKILNDGMCLYIEGMMIAKSEFSSHYNSLHREYLKRFNQGQSPSTKEKEDGYPVVNPSFKPVFESSVELYKQGVFNLEQLMVRIQRYIQPDKQEQVLATITK